VKIVVAEGDPHASALPSPAFGVMTEQFTAGVPILAHGGKASKFFTENVAPADLASFAAVPLQVRGNMIGVLNVFSFTAGKKFDEGHRKTLAVLASRSASAIDNARLYEDLRSTNDSLVRANTSLEEMFQQTVAGFAQALEESDMYTRGHSERVAVYSEILARGLALPEAEIRRVVQAGVM